MPLQYEHVRVETGNIVDCPTFHDEFSRVLGFPNFYGRNMDAWIDCLTSADTPEDGLTRVHAPENGVLVLELKGMRDLRKRCPELAEAIEECAAFVNWRRIEVGEPPVLVLSYRD